MSDKEDFVRLLKEDEKIFESLRERIAGMGEKADRLREFHENVEGEIQRLEEKINSTLEKIEEAEELVRKAESYDKFRENRRKGMDPDEDDWYSGNVEEFFEEDEEVKKFIQEFAKYAREIEKDTKEINQLIEDAENKVKEEYRKLENLNEADAALANIERKLEELNSRLPNWNNQNL